ncbi:MAG: ATP-binding protein [Tractidigestivibacter sp.]|jgi:hypothetical protein|uniref:ATP-binding protein n=1 Tax=Tractidigestivibacter sp. TaxID=2847320 RepID=UPI003D930AD9
MSQSVYAAFTSASYLLSITITVQLCLAALMFEAVLPRRSRFVLRFALCAAAIGAVSFFLYRNLMVQSVFKPRSVSLLLEGLDFVVILAMMVGMTLVCSHVSLWTAIFCSTAAYTIQNLASSLTYYCFMILEGTGTSMASPLFIPLNILGVVVVYPICAYLFGGPIRRGGLVEIEDRKMLLMFALVILIAIFFDIENKTLYTNGLALPLVLVLRLVHDIVCVTALAMQFEMLYTRSLETNVATLKRIGDDQKRNYRLVRQSINAVNARLESLRKQVSDAIADGGADAATVDRLVSATRLPGVRVKTGNEALDALLLLKGLVCEQEGVTLSSVADGGALSFMSEEDVYSLIGNAIDNALDAVTKVKDPEKHAIGLVVRRSGDLASINVENYYTGDVHMIDGLPQTTAEDPKGHGLGTRSMRDVAERYGGTVTFSTDGDIFHMNALIPIPE